MELLILLLFVWAISRLFRKKKKRTNSNISPSQNSYVDLDNKFRSFRITRMTRSDFLNFHSVGMSMLEIIPDYMPDVWNEEKSNGLSLSRFHENIPEKLLDYACRFGEWDSGRSIFPYLENRNIYSDDYSRSLINSFLSRERSVFLVSRLLNQNGEMSKNDIIKALHDEPTEHIQWAMRFYKGFFVRKDGSKYFVSFCDIK